MPHWRALGAGDWVCKTLESGFHLKWGPHKAPLSGSPIFSSPPSNIDSREVLALEVMSLLAKGAIEEIFPPWSPGFYGRLFYVRKASGGWRPVLDLSTLNLFLEKVKFKMETPASIREAIRPGDWAASIDLTDAYFHIPIFPGDRKYLRFTWEGRVFGFRVLPFGQSLAPWLFTRVVREFILHLRESGIRIHVYLDDWLVLASQNDLCASHVLRVLEQARSLGFRENEMKSELTPSQSFVFLGMRFDTVNMLVFPPEERIVKLLETILTLSRRESASARALAGLLGQMESLSPLLVLGRLHKKAFQRNFRDRWSQAIQSWDKSIRLGPWFLMSVQQWLNQTWLRQGVPILSSPPSVELFTDASHQGWGGHLGSLVASGSWSPEWRLKHINLLELQVVRLCLESFLPSLVGKTVKLATDNSTAACYVNKQGGGGGGGRQNLILSP